MKRIISSIAIILLISTGTSVAQCPMCKASLESNIKNKDEDTKKVGAGLNKGILYLLAMPFMAVGAIAGAYFYHKKQN